MKLSIITINYNNVAGLQKTLESVFRQTCRAFEYIVVDGASEELEKLDIKMPVHSYGVLCDEMLVAAYRAASVMVVPSLSENLSNVIMESLSCGTPVVAFNTGGNADLIDHQNNGYLAKPFSTEDLAFGIHWCLQNNRDNNLSVHARKKVANNFTEEIVAQQYLSLYQLLYEKDINFGF